jgi:hypothetical protein
MKNELAVLTTSDLNAAGINSQLSSNDLVEVVAHDIYDKYTESITNVIANGELIYKRYNQLFDVERNKMKSSLSKYFKKDEDIEVVEDAEDFDEYDFSGVAFSFGKIDEYWPSINISTISLKEKDKGTFAERSYRSIPMPPLKMKSVRVKLILSTPNKSDTAEVKQAGITGSIETTIKKTFTQIITTPIARFKKLADEVNEYNKQVDDLCEFLPKNGLLSVERFTREARVKMNKKIISAQSPDFRKKISELFNIKL